MAAALDRQELPARRFGEDPTALVGLDPIVVPVDHEHGAADPAAELERRLSVRDTRGVACRDQGLGIRLESPADGILDLLRRMRLAEDL